MTGKVAFFITTRLALGLFSCFVQSHHLPGRVKNSGAGVGVVVAALVPLNAEEEGRTAFVAEKEDCNNKLYTEIDILVKENDNAPYLHTCVNMKNVTTVWSQSKIDGPAMTDKMCRKEKVCNCVASHCSRTNNWSDGAFRPDFNVEKSYKKKSQFATLADILGSKALMEKYTRPSDYFFAKGHLSPNSDGAWDWERKATFFYINAVPQWQVINGGNWARLEAATQKYAKEHRVVLELWTGAIGVTTLKDVNGNLKEIYLGRGNDNKPIPYKLPAPRLMWKMIYDPKSDAGIVILMINNPFEENHLEEDRSLCPGVCERTSLVNWTRTDVKKGYTICCSVAEFKKQFPEVSAPGLDDLGDIPLLGEQKRVTPVHPVKPVKPEQDVDADADAELDVKNKDEDDGDKDDPEWKP